MTDEIPAQPVPEPRAPRVPALSESFPVAAAIGVATRRIALGAVGGALVGPAVFRRAYWGYWFSRPDSSETIADVARVERYTELIVQDGTSQSGVTAFLDTAQWARAGVGESPTGQLCAALVRAGLRPRSDEPVPRALLDAVLASNPKPETPTIQFVTVALCTTRDGTEQVLATLQGDELSNDHYQYRELVATGRVPVQVLRETTFAYDVAGMEGMAHVLGVCPGALVGLLAAGAWGITRRRRRRRRSRRRGTDVPGGPRPALPSAP